MTKLIRLGLTLVLSLLAVSTFAANQEMMKLRKIIGNKTAVKNQISLLFLQQASSGSFLPVANKKGTYQLTLNNVKKKTLYFSDQPKRIVGSLDTADFVTMIANNSRHYGISPNVAIQGYIIKKGSIIEINRIAVLSNPKYNPKTNSVSYDAVPLSQSTFEPVKRLKNITLFFDNVRPWPP